MYVLVACEESGVVRDAFRARGHNAYSCDIQDTSTEDKRYHFKGDVQDYIVDFPWELVIAHPPCTRLCVSGARWFKKFPEEQKEAIDFFMFFAHLDVPRLAIENPVGIMSTVWRKPDQYIQPWQFGHGETKKTGLWLKNLPLLKPTKVVDGRENRIHRMSPSPERGKLRSKTYQGIAEAMASQWGSIV